MKLHMNALQQLGAESQEQLPGSSTTSIAPRGPQQIGSTARRAQIDYSAFWARAWTRLSKPLHASILNPPSLSGVAGLPTFQKCTSTSCPPSSQRDGILKEPLSRKCLASHTLGHRRALEALRRLVAVCFP